MPRTRMSRRSGQRRKLVWADSVITESGTTTQQGRDLLVGLRAVSGAVGAGVTSMGVLIQQNALANGASPTFATAFQLGLVVSDASAEGDLPDVVTQPYADWVWNSRYYLGDGATVGGSLDAQHREIRVRSRRRIEEVGQSLWLVVQPVLGGADSIDYTAHVRVLLALP
jgi:hypothetical protein